MRRALLATGGLLLASVSCGASIRGLYESDVRFEHCMALDARPDVKPTLRRSCWEEWLSFYTFGQTRDRIDYALLREKQLGSASDFDEGEPGPARVAAAAAPDPTSAIAPPPLLMADTDGGAPHPPEPELTPAEKEKKAALARCAGECQEAAAACSKVCRATPACVKACGGRQSRCESRCEAKKTSPK
jgi:hypothetical protein